MRYALICLLLAGCAAPLPGNVISTKWVELDEQDLQRTCSSRAERTTMPRRSYSLSSLMASSEKAEHGSFNGCFDWINGTCVIYTRKATPETLNIPRFQQTLGHEVMHCYKGFFH